MLVGPVGGVKIENVGENVDICVQKKEKMEKRVRLLRLLWGGREEAQVDGSNSPIHIRLDEKTCAVVLQSEECVDEEGNLGMKT